jgi:subtilisin family serine protease
VLVSAGVISLASFALLLLLLSAIRTRASFSNCNNNLDFCAPGYKIWSTITYQGSYGPKYGANDYASGTSMAAPYVTGVIAKIWSQCPACSHVEVESCLHGTADSDSLVGYYPQCFGSGLVQAEDAYKCLTSSCCSPTTEAPTSSPSVVPSSSPSAVPSSSPSAVPA